VLVSVSMTAEYYIVRQFVKLRFTEFYRIWSEIWEHKN